MEIISEGGGAEAAGGMDIIVKTLDEEEQINTNSLAIEDVVGQIDFKLGQLRQLFQGNSDLVSLIDQVITDKDTWQELSKDQLTIALATVEKAKETENALLLTQSECDLASVNGEQLALLSGEKQLLADQLSTTQLLLQNKETALTQLDEQLSNVNRQLTDSIELVGQAPSADQQVALLVEVVKTKETEKTQMNNMMQQLQDQLQNVANKLFMTENTYAAQLEELRQAAVAKESERLAREELFRQFQTQAEQQLQLVIAEKNALEEQVTNNVLQLTNTSQEIQQVKEQCDQTVEEKELQLSNLSEQYTTKLDEMNQAFLVVQNNNDFANEEIKRLNQKLEVLENNNQVLTIGSQEILAIQLAESSKELDTMGKENAKLRTDNLALTTNTTRLQQEIASCQSKATQVNEQVSKLNAEKETLRKTNTELTSRVNLLTQETQQLAKNKEEITKINQQLSTAKSQVTALQLEKSKLQVDNTQLRSEVNSMNIKLNEMSGRLAVIAKENDQLAIIDPNAALTTQSLLVAQQSLKSVQGSLKVLQVERDNAVKESEVLRKEVLDLRGTLAQKNSQVQDCRLLSQKDQKIADAIKGVRLFRIDLTTGKAIEEKAESFNPQTNILHRSVLIFGPSERRLIEATAPYDAKLRKMMLVEGTQFFTFLQKDPDWQGDYIVLKRSEWRKLRENYCRPCISTVVGEGPIIIHTTTTQTLLGLGSSAVALNHIEALNQLSWQESTRHLRDYPGEYQVEVRFSRGKPSLGYTEELRFVASNVHLIKDPNYASGDNFYVIDLTRPDTMSNLYYTSVGTLVLNGIHGHGSFAFRILNKTTGDVVKSAIVEDYAIEEDVTRPYNTKLVFSPSEGVIFYARDTGRDTYILETILIKQ